MDCGLLGYRALTIKRQDSVWKFEHQGGKLSGAQKVSDEKNPIGWDVSHDYWGHFAFSLTSQNKLHFIYKSNNEETIYGFFPSTGKVEVIRLDLPQGEQIIYQKIICISNNNVLIVVFTEDQVRQNWKIYSFTQDEYEEFQKGEIVDSGVGFSPGRGSLAMGRGGQVYLVYQVVEQGQYQLVYRIYKNNSWSQRTFILASPEFNLNPIITIDTEGMPHLIWLRFLQSQGKVIYANKKKINNFWARWRWDQENLILPSTINCFAPIIFSQGKGLGIYWQQFEGNYSTLYYWHKGSIEPPKVIKRFNCEALKHITLDLDQYPILDNYTLLEYESTLLLLLSEDLIPDESLEPVEQFDTREPEEIRELTLMRDKVERLELENANLEKNILKVNEKFIRSQCEWEQKEKELDGEIKRLKKSLVAIQRVNDELRQGFAEKQCLLENSEEKEANVIKANAIKPNVSKMYPHFPFWGKSTNNRK